MKYISLVAVLLISRLHAGLINTFAGGGLGDGGDALNALAYEPVQIASDASGNFYFVEVGSSRVRKVDIATGLISSVAGTAMDGFSGDGGQGSAAKLAYPFGVACDTVNNVLYISDRNNQRIRKLDLGSGIISSIAGTGAFGFAGDGGNALTAQFRNPGHLALDELNQLLYISDASNYRLRRINLASNVISTIAGNGSSAWPGEGVTALGSSLYGLEGL